MRFRTKCFGVLREKKPLKSQLVKFVNSVLLLSMKVRPLLVKEATTWKNYTILSKLTKPVSNGFSREYSLRNFSGKGYIWTHHELTPCVYHILSSFWNFLNIYNIKHKASSSDFYHLNYHYLQKYCHNQVSNQDLLNPVL